MTSMFYIPSAIFLAIVPLLLAICRHHHHLYSTELYLLVHSISKLKNLKKQMKQDKASPLFDLLVFNKVSTTIFLCLQ